MDSEGALGGSLLFVTRGRLQGGKILLMFQEVVDGGLKDFGLLIRIVGE